MARIFITLPFQFALHLLGFHRFTGPEKPPLPYLADTGPIRVTYLFDDPDLDAVFFRRQIS
jgi:hypothetical protein